MINQFSHIIVTRFNLPLSEFSLDKNNKKTLTEEWYEHRINIFREVTCRSMVNQTNQNFEWYVLVSNDTPEKWLREIEASLLGENQKVRIISRPGQWQTEALRSTGFAKFMVTTRLDNDDGLAREFVDYVHSIMRLTENKLLELPLVINFSTGLEWNGRAYYHREYRSNNFCSLVSPITVGSFVDVYYTSHGEMAGHFAAIDIKTKRPMWLQTIHDNNVSNRIIGDPIASTPADISERFGVRAGLWWSNEGTLLRSNKESLYLSRLFLEQPDRVQPDLADPKKYRVMEDRIFLFPSGGYRNKISFDIPSNGFEFVTIVENQSARAQAADFILEVCNQKGEQLVRDVVSLDGGTTREWHVTIPPHYAPLEMSLSTMMSDPSTNTDYAWTFFLEPQLRLT